MRQERPRQKCGAGDRNGRRAWRWRGRRGPPGETAGGEEVQEPDENERISLPALFRAAKQN